MTRAEYMEKLAQGLKDYDEDFALDIIGDYRRHFDEAAAERDVIYSIQVSEHIGLILMCISGSVMHISSVVRSKLF